MGSWESYVVPDTIDWLLEPGRFYRDKYRGTVWQLIILAEHFSDGSNPQIRAACENLLDWSQDRESHGFAFDESAQGAV